MIIRKRKSEKNVNSKIMIIFLLLDLFPRDTVMKKLVLC